MADKSSQLVLDALSRAVAEPAGLPLHGSKSDPGLFPGTGPAKQVAQRCIEDGHLQCVRSETKGKTVRELYTLSERGLVHLLAHVSPKQVLEDLVRAVEARQGQVTELLRTTRQMQEGFDALKNAALQVLRVFGQSSDLNELHRQFLAGAANGNGKPSADWLPTALDYLTRWQQSSAQEDCPLADLYRHVQKSTPQLTIGQFHDGLRRLHDQEQVYLHPWTGPLCEMPEPPFALLVGHEIAYYASIRR